MAFTDLKPRPGGASFPRRDRSRDRSRGRLGRAARSLPLVALAVLLAAVLLVSARLRDRPAREAPIRVVEVPTPPAPVVVSDTLRRGETLAELLARRGFTPAGAHRLVEGVRPFRSPRALRPGVVVHLHGPADGPPEEAWLELTPDERLRMRSTGEGWVASLDSVPVMVDTILLAGLIRSSLWESELTGDGERLGREEFAQLVWGLSSRIFAWKIDFSRDIQSGDAFRVAVERRVRPDGTVRSFRFLAAEMRNRGRQLPAIPFLRPDGRLEYYDTEGESLRGTFLRAPLEFRVTSGFSRRRYHPILKRSRPHLGTDYGAPHGAPVQATASGVVTRAGWWGGYGRAVEIRHAGGIRTRYAHLSRIGVGVGQRVQQGDVIGRVGATGLATAAHLHYEFLQNGAHRNPASVDLPPAPSLEPEYRAPFRTAAREALELLDRLALPGAPEGPRLAEAPRTAD